MECVDTANPANNRIVPFNTREWKDTIRLPARPGAGGGVTKTILRAATVFSDVGREGQIYASGKTPSPGRSGGWLFHCHIFEHADNGMMSFIEIK
ncbi:MAG: multicopper oxidase domain-containing protein [Acidimicrobiales bacterium]